MSAGTQIIQFVAFTIFSTPVLGILCFLLASVYVWKRIHYRIVFRRGRAGYSIKAVNWAILGLSFIIFPLIPLESGRALLRISLSLLIISELLYNWAYIAVMAREFVAWTKTQSLL